MKYLCHVTSKIFSSINAENMRGEPRWERNVLEALLSQGEICHTTTPIWLSKQPKPDNFYDGINPEWQDDSILITHGVGRALHITTNARYYIVQFHEPPNEETTTKFMAYDKKNPGCIISTTDSLNPHTYNRIQAAIGPNKLYHVYGPMIPYVDLQADNWRKPYMIWTYRNFTSFMDEQPDSIERLFDFLVPILQQEPETRIKIIVGVWDIWGPLGHSPTSEALKQWMTSYSVMTKYKDIWDRIDLYCNLHWHEVLDLLKETRWVISPAEPLGCPAYEAAMFGIPIIVNEDVNVFMTGHKATAFSDVLTSKRAVTKEFISCLEEFQTSHTYYRKYGDVYRNFVANSVTYHAYVTKLKEITNQRNWK